MDKSEEQFQELLAHFVAVINKSLFEQKYVLVRLVLHASGTVEITLGFANTAEEREEVLDAMVDTTREITSDTTVEAVCIGYPERDNECYEVLLENRDNYCLHLRVPVDIYKGPGLNLEDLSEQDSAVLFFPESKE